MLRLLTLLTIILGVGVGVACSDDDDGGTDPPTEFTATLNGESEVPPVATDATGSATLTVNEDQIDYTVNVDGIENAVVAHIHIEDTPGGNGPVRLNLCGTGAPQPPCTSGTGVLATGSNGTIVGDGVSFDSLVSAMQSGGAYVNVHTDDGAPPPNTGAGDMASGEIRGDIAAD
jgi:hypothetical protein